MIGKLFGRSVPAYLWIAVFYVIYVLVIAAPEVAGSMVGGDDSATPVAEDAAGAGAEDTAQTSDGDLGTVSEAAPSAESDATISARVTANVEDVLRQPLFHVPLFSGVEFPVSWTTFFIVAGFVSAWIEALRATNIRASGNDFMSLIVTVVALVLFFGVPWFGTTAFLIVPLVGFGDLILDRYIGQAVARRDFGAVYGPHDGGDG